MSKNAVMPLADYKNACDNIREKTETTEAIKSGELPKKINDVYEAGQMAGQKAEHDKMWDVFQQNGDNTTNNNYLTPTGFFGSGRFTFDNFYPKYDIRPVGNASHLFYAWESKYGNVVGSLTQRLKECGVVLDTSKATSLSQIFNYSRFTEIPTIDFSSVTAACSGCFANHYGALKTIEKIIVHENLTYGNWFNNTTALENVRFEGVIGQNGLDFSPCKSLTYDSCHSIFTHLKDFREIIADKVAIPYDANGYAFAEYTLIAGQKYSGTYINEAYGSAHFSSTPQNVEVPIVGQRLAVVFKMIDPMGGAHEVYIYNNNGNLCIFDTFGQSMDAEISIFTITETRTITMPTAVRDNGNAIPEDIAEATERGWTIVWS